MDLTPKQKAFADEWLKDQNATRAAIAAGYKKKSAYSIGSENLSKPEIKAYIEKRMAPIAKKRVFDSQVVLEEIGRICTQNAKELYDQDGNLIPIHLLPDDVAATISAVEAEETVTLGTEGSPTVLTRTKKIKRYDKVRALETAGRIFKLFGAEPPTSNNTVIYVNIAQ